MSYPCIILAICLTTLTVLIEVPVRNETVNMDTLLLKARKNIRTLKEEETTGCMSGVKRSSTTVYESGKLNEISKCWCKQAENIK